MSDQKTETEVWEEYLEEQREREEGLAEAYREAGMLPPGSAPQDVGTRSVEEQRERDNIVVSGASPSHQKSETEVWEEYLEEQREREEGLAEAYREAGMLPPGSAPQDVGTRSVEENYATRDNIVVSGASPSHLQAAVEGLADEDLQQDRAHLDAADVAQSVSREDYEDAVRSAEIGVADEAKPDHPGEVESGEDLDEPRASGGTQPDEDEADGIFTPDDDEVPYEEQSNEERGVAESPASGVPLPAEEDPCDDEKDED